jgi:hypothetical protein
MGTIEVLSPRVQVAAAGAPLAPRPLSLDGKVLGLLNNAKPNADVLQERVAELLALRFAIKGQVWKRKPGASSPAEGLEAFSHECDVVVNASGD